MLARSFVGVALALCSLAGCDAQPDDRTPASPSEIVGSAPEAEIAAPPDAGGTPRGVMRYLGGPQQASNPICANPQLSYFGGPILQSPIIVGVFWTDTVNATLQANIGQFYADVTVSSYWTWLHEYDSVGLSPGTSQAILPGTFGGNFVIAPLKCAPGGANCKLNDDDLQAELARQIDLGVLPAPALDCTGNVRTIYMIDLPPNISLTGPAGAGKSCANMGFCAYHNTGTYGAGNTPLIYGAHMDYFTGPCAFGCGGDAAPLDVATVVHAHELVEAVTDPDIGLDLSINYAFPAGWGDNDNNCGEIADICADGAPGDVIVVGGNSWAVQQVWSNQQHKCVSSGLALSICTGVNVAACRKCSCGDDGLACGGVTPVCETTSGNVLFGGCEACTAASANCAGGATCQQSMTPALDDICVGCVPLVACPAGDDCGSVSDGCGGMIPCGACALPETCGGGNPGTPNHCGCTALKACPAGDDCGSLPDGCGGMISCGSCVAPATCGTPGNPNQCTCVPLVACPAGDDCGSVSDGCGGMIPCGVCMPPEACGGGNPGSPNHCGCTKLTTCPAGDDCGSIPDGCGGLVDCGSCVAPATCGTPANPNQCTCSPMKACPAGDDCGSVPDGCGGDVVCGECAAPDTCGGGDPSKPNHCGCTPLKTCPLGVDCGSASDACGGVVECGSCVPPATCGGGDPGKINHCGCTPLKACAMGEDCGSEADGCGDVVSCGECGPNEVCAGHQCITEATTASSVAASSSSGSSSSGRGAGGSPAGPSSSAWIPLTGRAGCSLAAPTEDAPGTGVALLGLVGLAARRRRARSLKPRAAAACPCSTRPSRPSPSGA